MLLNRYRRWKFALAAGRLGRVWRDEVRPARRVARARGRLRSLGRLLSDLAFLLRVERVSIFAQFALGFALAAPRWSAAEVRLLVLAIFCLGPCLYGGLYALNDAADAAADRLNPAKRGRPVAAGRISPLAARGLGGALVLTGLGLALALDVRVFVLGLVFTVINLLYTHVFKHRRWFDLFFNMATHPLRLGGGMWLAGSVAHWPLLVVWSLVILSDCAIKRLYELRTAPLASRPVLRRYNAAHLLRFVAVCQGVGLGVCVFLPPVELILGALALSWSFILAFGHRQACAGRILARLGR